VTSATIDTRPRTDTSAGLALAGYILLSLSVFAAGVPALIAVALAYWRRGRSPAWLRGHFNRQIVIFWIAVLLLVVAMALGVAAMVVWLVSLAHVRSHEGWTTVSMDSSRLVSFDPDLDQLGLPTPVAGLALGALGVWVLSTLWLFIAPIFGLIALARSPFLGDRER
jgi:uncharacterized membrane protein